MVNFKRKPVHYVPVPPINDDAEVWFIEETDEVFPQYEDYLRRNDFYRQRKFADEITGHSNMTFREAWRSEREAEGQVDDGFPEPLRDPVLRKVQFSQIPRIDHLVDHVYEEFRRDYYPGERVLIEADDTHLTGQIREKTRFPELSRADGTVERHAFSRYFCYIDQRPSEEALVDDEHIKRERKIFTKQRLRSFLKNSVVREAWTGAPWLVKQKLAEEYHINTEIPPYLTQEYQTKLKKTSNSAGKKGDYDGASLNFQAYGPQQPGLHPLRPKSSKKWTAQEEQYWNQLQYSQYQASIASNPDFGKLPIPLHPSYQGPPQNGQVANGYHAIAAKGQTKPASQPPPKYPIEDLEIPPIHDGTHRPPIRFLSETTPTLGRVSEGAGGGIEMESVGLLLETWDTLNVYCEVFQLDSFTFDDYVEALRFTSEDVQCELLVEIHCAVLKRLVNDVNDKNGQVQVTLPHQSESEEDESYQENSHNPTPTPELEPEDRKPPARSTRSSLVKSEAAELRDATNGSSLSETKTHRAVEMDHSTRGYDWKMRLRKRDFQEGHWVVILVGLLNQLSRNARLSKTCHNILAQLAPLDQDPTPETAILQYQKLDINLRVKILQILCMKSIETKAIRQYMEDCSIQMTEHRKEKNEIQRSRRAAVEELRQLHEERKALQPESTLDSPPAETEELEMLDEPKAEPVDEEIPDSDFAADSENEVPHQGRSLRRANDRAAARKKKAEEEKERKAMIAAEKAKKPSKQEKQYEKVLKKIEEIKENIKDYEEEVIVIENDLREADCPRTRVLGKDRFWNRYYWMERNAMPYAGLPDSSTANAGYANGRIWIQGPDDLERKGFIELSEAENQQYRRAFQMSVPERKMKEEGDTHVFTARQWGYYEDPDSLDMLIGWLDVRGVREMKLRKELASQRELICTHMKKRQEYNCNKDDGNPEPSEPATRVSTRTKTYVDPSGHGCLRWRNSTAIRELGHLHSEPKPPPAKKQRGVAVKKSLIVEEEPSAPAARQTRGGGRGSSGSKGGTADVAGQRMPTRQGSRYNF